MPPILQALIQSSKLVTLLILRFGSERMRRNQSSCGEVSVYGIVRFTRCKLRNPPQYARETGKALCTAWT